MAKKRLRNGDKAVVNVIIYAIEQILDMTAEDQKEKHLSPIDFGRIVEGLPLFSRHRTLSQSKIQKYRNQLLNALEYWPSDSDWKVKESQSNQFKLVFKRKNQVDEGKR